MRDSQETQLVYVLKALLYQDENMLRRWIVILKQSDGEGWAIGQLLSRVLEVLEDKQRIA